MIKISDFGLSENAYVNQYSFIEDTEKRLPLRWMAIESIFRGMYSEKSDVVYYSKPKIICNSCVLVFYCI